MAESSLFSFSCLHVFPVLILASNALDFEVSQQPSPAWLNLPFFDNTSIQDDPMTTGPRIHRPQRIATPRRPASVFQPQLVTLTQRASQQPHQRTHKASSRASQRPLQEETIQSHIPVARPMVTPIYKEVRILTDVDILKVGLQGRLNLHPGSVAYIFARQAERER